MPRLRTPQRGADERAPLTGSQRDDHRTRFDRFLAPEALLKALAPEVDSIDSRASFPQSCREPHLPKKGEVLDAEPLCDLLGRASTTRPRRLVKHAYNNDLWLFIRLGFGRVHPQFWDSPR